MFDPDDPLVFQQGICRRKRNAGKLRDIVHDDSDIDRREDIEIISIDLFLRIMIIDRRDRGHRAGSGFFGMLCQIDRVARIERADMHDDRHAGFLQHDFGDRLPLVVRKQEPLARRTAAIKSFDSRILFVPHQFPQHSHIQFAVFIVGRQKRRIHRRTIECFFYHAVHPPSITKLEPVIYFEAFDARKIMAPLYSSACAIRPTGIRLQ